MKEKKDPNAPLQTGVISRSNSEPAAVQRGGTNGIQKPPVLRKTAILNKEKRQKVVSSPPWDTSVEDKAAQTKVSGSHQRQNTVGPESIQTDTEGIITKPNHPGEGKEHNNRKVGLSPKVKMNTGNNMQPNPVTKQRGKVRGLEKVDDTAMEKSSGPRVEAAEGRTDSERGGGGVPQDSFELSFQEKIHRWECDRQIESMELGEFELLEQAAEELSFSSNSSFVMKVPYSTY